MFLDSVLQKRIGFLHFIKIKDPHIEIKILRLSFQFDCSVEIGIYGSFFKFENIDKFIVILDKDIEKFIDFDFIFHRRDHF